MKTEGFISNGPSYSPIGFKLKCYHYTFPDYCIVNSKCLASFRD